MSCDSCQGDYFRDQRSQASQIPLLVDLIRSKAKDGRAEPLTSPV